MRELAAQADYEDAEFEDRPTRALARREARALAREDRDDRADREPTVVRETSPWMPLAIGLGIIAVVGVMGVVVYLLVRRKDDGSSTVLGAVDPRNYLPQPVPQAAPAPVVQPQVYVIHTGSGDAQVVRADPVASPPPASDNATLAALSRIETGIGALVGHNQQPYGQSTMRTYRLPWLGDTSTPSVRIATSGNVSQEVTVRVVAPPGALAAFSFSPNELNLGQAIVGPGMSTVPAGDTLVVPSGQQQTIHMNARQVLYAKGNMAPTNPTGAVVISISSVDNYSSR
jgi:hypothetical protein